jgi:uncharacterized Zn-binding protein involved in type VI secretion
MPSAQRQGDTNSAGGVATSGVDSVRVNGKPVVEQRVIKATETRKADTETD